MIIIKKLVQIIKFSYATNKLIRDFFKNKFKIQLPIFNNIQK